MGGWLMATGALVGLSSISVRRLLRLVRQAEPLSDPALLCCMMEMGIDRILFSVDYPFVDNPPGTKWTETLPICAEDKEKLLNLNAKRLLKI